MAFDATTTPASGDDTKLVDYTRLRDNCKSLAGSGSSHDLGGSLDKFVEDTSFVDLPDGWECEIDGTELSGRSVYFEVNALAEVAVAVTATLRLFDVTGAAAVASSDVAIVSPGTTRTQGKSGALTLNASLRKYKAQIKGSVGAASKVAGRARVIIR
jgi:hypothetical protein